MHELSQRDFTSLQDLLEKALLACQDLSMRNQRGQEDCYLRKENEEEFKHS